ncbi:class I SAM-dependent DNA methyltransferase [Deinococcus sp. SDU3-2]|uniref:site-specific DNA-methyltransferase (adenine-specific) n=1 Tax=Deinococcus terrestris TaxID=2651870 RepID=A0A7X1NXV6_9DEIO|nr:DNA methyltransferase [Deinococcus terrestris]MPY67815.1 class I SAM-dependent DNA methyltransferase [Deinococcus terrestris]
MTPEQFVKTYGALSVNERSAAQSHFIDLCALLGVPNPVQGDPSGETYRFEKPVSKITGKKGFADVWKAGAFGWEYKGKGADLKRAYEQLVSYREDLQNPPLLVVSDMHTVEVHTNFTGTLKAVRRYTLEDLLDESKRLELRKVWTEPEAFNPSAQAADVTEAVMRELVQVGDALKERGEQPDDVAHFLVKCVFTLFAEDVGLLPRKTFALLLEAAEERPEDFREMAGELFRLMKGGGLSVVGRIPHINGGVFTNPAAPDLRLPDVQTLQRAARRDWRKLEPAIFGTLFERVIDPDKRSQLGAHYTPLADIVDVVEPVMLAPLRAEWEALRAELVPLMELAEAAEAAAGGLWEAAEGKERAAVVEKLRAFQDRLAAVTVLDPACGSGNFLYTALRLLLDLEAEVRATLRGLTGQAQPVKVSPRQMRGLERSEYAHEIAGMVLWIGYLQWLSEHGENLRDRSPVLDALPGLENRDAVLDGDRAAAWPPAEFITGNPPFLGNYKMREELGGEYAETLRAAYAGRVPGFADLVAYWFEKAREQIEQGHTRRAGLIATNSIRGGKNRVVLERIAETGSIFRAWPDRVWIQDGAAVRTSIVCFDDGSEQARVLLRHTGDEDRPEQRGTEAREVAVIHPDLTSAADLTAARRLRENAGKSFEGVKPAGKFDLPGSVAREWLDLPNPSGLSNADVLRPYVGGDDLTDRNKDRYTVDFNQMPFEVAEQYRRPMRYLSEEAKDKNGKTPKDSKREKWWLYDRARPELRAALEPLSRFIATPRHMKHRSFSWLTPGCIPGDALTVIAAEDDLTFGVLNSSPHTAWALRMGTSLEDRPRYTPTTCFETFPFPRPSPEQAEAIAQVARFLETARAFLRTKRDPKQKANAGTSEQDKTLTLTGMYNLLSDYRQTGQEVVTGLATLADAHDTLDRAVSAAYGWEWPLDEDEMLSRLLALNLERHAAETAGSAEAGQARETAPA